MFFVWVVVILNQIFKNWFSGHFLVFAALNEVKNGQKVKSGQKVKDGQKGKNEVKSLF